MSGTKRSRIRYEKICGQCQTKFTVPEYRKESAKFCSRKCTALSTREQTTANCQECGTEFTHIASRANKAKYCSPLCYHRAMHKKGTVEYTCAHCGKLFLDSPSHKRKYCSRACINKAAKNVWKPGFTTVRKKMAKRGLIFACEHCGYDQVPEILGVHHKDHNRKNNDLSNLVVLCPNCHSLEHRKHTPH